MIKKTVKAFRCNERIWGAKIEYRIWGILIYKEEVFPPDTTDEFEWLY